MKIPLMASIMEVRKRYLAYQPLRYYILLSAT